MSEPIIACKGFDKDMKCRGFQYAEGETYHFPRAVLCKEGAHACTMPLDVLGYYPPGDGSIYRMVELDEVCDKKSNDSKICAKTIKIGAEIGIPGLVKAQIEWVKNTIGFDEKIKKAKESPDKYATGNLGAASATGIQGAAAATGIQGAASATGKASVAMASGDDGRVMGAIGCAIFAVERGGWDGDTYPIISVAAGIVDGVTLKEKTWYKCVGGKFVEV
jgi:hypothetical protein|nr:MAG TPA_asm: hypothetical protein [Caudoviricetes sp.]